MVLTNGCFDVLHAGHVRYLAAARSLGDALVVGINSDESVRRLKGPGRPVTGQEERAEIIAALAAVDWVTIFDEDTASELVEALRPALYVKGGDYSSDAESERFPVEGLVARRLGGDVRIVDFVPDRSSTRLLREISARMDRPSESR